MYVVQDSDDPIATVPGRMGERDGSYPRDNIIGVEFGGVGTPRPRHAYVFPHQCGVNLIGPDSYEIVINIIDGESRDRRS